MTALNTPSAISSFPRVYPKASNIFTPTEVRIISDYAGYIATMARKQINFGIDSSIWIDPLVTFLVKNNDEFKIKPTNVLFDCSEVDELLTENEIAHSRVDINSVTLSLSLLGVHSDKEIDTIGVRNRIDFIDEVTISIASELCPKRGLRLDIKSNQTSGSIETSKELLKYLIIDKILNNTRYMYSRNEHLFVSRPNKNAVTVSMDIGKSSTSQVSPPAIVYPVMAELICPNSDKAIKRKKRMTHTRARKGA